MNRLLATIFVVGLSIALTVAGIALITTMYNSMMWRPETLRILETRIYRNEGSWWLYIEVYNAGDSTAEIHKIEIYGVEEHTIDPSITVEPGQTIQKHIKLDKEYSYETMYTVKLYLKSGTIYPVLEKVTKT